MNDRPAAIVSRLHNVPAGLILALACSIAGAAEPPSVDTDGPAGSGLRLRDTKPPGTVIGQADEKGTRNRADSLLAADNLDEPEASTAKFFGFDQFETAYTLPRPAHWSKAINRLELGVQGAFNDTLKWKLSGRYDYNAIYDLGDHYPSRVRDDGRHNAMFRETYVDWDAGAVDFRFGRQQIVWGEVVGLFFADVVSARDLRETILPDFDLLRIPQWAARAEYFRNDIHLEAAWIPKPTIDRIGRPGGEFFSYPPPGPPGFGYVINDEQKQNNFTHQNFGIRASILRGGWDVASFAYRSLDTAATYFREITPGPIPAVVYTPKHEMITQYGLTASKDLGDFIVKAEAIYNVGKNFNTLSFADGDGVVSQNYLDYIFSFEVPLPNDSRFNAQFYQRRFKDHDPNIIPRKIESGASLYWAGKWGDRFEPQILLIRSLNRNDYLVRPKVVWNFRKEWRAVAGVDIFGGSATGLFGQYDKQDRVYLEVRRSF